MEQMTKEELIEFFIEQLGDNRILGKVISIDQIREKLNYIINDITYRQNKTIFAKASWNPEPTGKGSLNFDLEKISTFEEYKKIIVHELLHALSTKIVLLGDGIYKNRKFKKINAKTGLELIKCSRYFIDGKNIQSSTENVAINEGMTDTLAEMITGVQNDTYNSQKNIYKIVSIIIGEDNALKEYFSENVPEEQAVLDIFKQDLIEKYGECLGNIINEDLKKVLVLSDKLLNTEINSVINGTTSRVTMMQDEIKNELCNTIENIICELIEWEEPEIIAKIDDILKLLISLNERISTKILNEFSQNQIMNTEEKQSMMDSILKKYFEVCPKSKRDWLAICNLYIESGNITLQNWNKKPILKNILEQDKPETVEDINSKVDKIKYKQVGDYYMLLCDDNYRNGSRMGELNKRIFDKNGMELNEDIIWSSSDRPVDTEVHNMVNKRIFKTKFDISQEEEISNLMEQLSQKQKDFKNRVLLDNQNKENNAYMNISSIGKMFRIRCVPDSENSNKIFEDFYYLNDNGLLEQIELRRRKKIYG